MPVEVAVVMWECEHGTGCAVCEVEYYNSRSTGTQYEVLRTIRSSYTSISDDRVEAAAAGYGSGLIAGLSLAGVEVWANGVMLVKPSAAI
jgi:hypothetical protein